MKYLLAIMMLCACTGWGVGIRGTAQHEQWAIITGGDFVTTNSGYEIHGWTNWSGTPSKLIVTSSGTLDLLVVASGGAGVSGGGGGGGVIITNYVASVGTNNIYIGYPVSSSGINSTAGVFVAIGGGLGGQVDVAKGLNGGSGGGGGAASTMQTYGGTNITGQGNFGGGNANFKSSPYASAGGGGAGAVGGNAQSASVGGVGGDGIVCSFSGTNVYYGGGGGGGTFSAGGTSQNGGLGGGGHGGVSGVGATAGTECTGGGGGGSGNAGTKVGGSGCIYARRKL